MLLHYVWFDSVFYFLLSHAVCHDNHFVKKNIMVLLLISDLTTPKSLQMSQGLFARVRVTPCGKEVSLVATKRTGSILYS